MVICDQMLLLQLFWGIMSCTHIRQQTVFWLPPFPQASSLRHKTMAIRPVNNATTASKCSSERKSCTCLVLNQKLEMTKLKEQGMLKVKASASCVKQLAKL